MNGETVEFIRAYLQKKIRTGIIISFVVNNFK